MANILLFHQLRDAVGAESISLPLRESLDTETFWKLLLQHAPQLEPYRSSTRIACNRTYLRAGSRIQPGDEIALIPPVSGG